MAYKSEHIKQKQAEASARWRENHPDRHRRATIKMHAKRLGFDGNEIADAWEAHSGLCDICGITERGTKKRLSIDHCHSTGKFRGFVCGRCNTLLGMAGDDIDVLASAISYLRERGE